MTISQTEAATRKLNRAQSALDKILEDGGDASQARADLLAAQVELEAAEAAAVERAQADEDRIGIEAGALSAAVAQEIGQALAQIIERIGPLPAPKVEHRWALGVAKARRETDSKRTAADATRERLAGQQQRLSSLKADRLTIVGRRLEGDERDSDGPTLALADADIEGLGGLVARTADELRRQDAELADAIERHERAEVRWTAAVQDAWVAALGEMALLGEGVIAECAGGLRTHGGDRKRWEPARNLKNLLHGGHY